MKELLVLHLLKAMASTSVAALPAQPKPFLRCLNRQY
jgi:hypothetical protein